MALDKYKAKRDFTRSPEPSGDPAHTSPAGRTPRYFCVQKHLASHLHYDFRLEHDGVLKSWAVPKGPSLDPKVKRLAMHVEDHPIEYGDFEGVIPSGYGAGIVMLWDRGTWMPEVEDVDLALRKGDLKLRLDGYKLKGSWVLVRTRGPGGGSGRSWLLMKHRDEWAGEIDITEFAPLSVKSRGDFADILAEDRPEVWISHRPAESGETGALFKRIIERALELRSGGSQGPEGPGAARASRSARAARATRPGRSARATSPAARPSPSTAPRASTRKAAGKRTRRG
ncbi:MAG: DNA polymerase ligase N-terminal domain-containing protein [Vicinamibacterales bacterium]